MNNEPPDYLDGARVLFWTPIDERHTCTGKTRHSVGGVEQTGFKGLAIAAYENESKDLQEEWYLFYCDKDWEVLNDTFHNSVRSAIEQAKFEYIGIDTTWVAK